MKAKSMILILIALGCGLVASIGISQVVMDKGGGKKEETVPILVAKIDIDISDKLSEENVKLEPWPKDRIPEGAIMSLKEVADKYPKSWLYEGDAIVTRKLTDKSPSIIQYGYRVFPIKVSADVVTQLIQPGDHVDILVFLRRGNEITMTKVKTVLHDVRIFAVNHQTERVDDKDGQMMNAKTVSVLVKPAQVELITLASELGKLKLSLRRHNDYQDENQTGSKGTSVQDLVGGPAQRGTDPKPRTDSSNNDTIKTMLDNLNKAKDQQTTAVEFNGKQMVILGPNGPDRIVRFNKQNKVAKSVSLKGGQEGNSAPPSPSPPPSDGTKKPETTE